MDEPLAFVRRQNAVVSWSTPTLVTSQHASATSVEQGSAVCIDVRTGNLLGPADHDFVIAVGTITAAIPGNEQVIVAFVKNGIGRFYGVRWMAGTSRHRRDGRVVVRLPRCGVQLNQLDA